MTRQSVLPRVSLLLALLISLCGAPVRTIADEVLITDGSRIVGTIERLDDQKLILLTDFAGKLEIARAKVVSVRTETPVNVAFASGDRLVGPVRWAQDPEQPVVDTALGPIAVAPSAITAVWPVGAESPETVAAAVEAERQVARYKPKWTATLEGGATRTEGNTDTLVGRGRFDLNRKTEIDLLSFYAQADYAEENKSRTRNEYLAGSRYQSAITERWYWYARSELEFDEFEDLDLRATMAAGLGYYWIKQTAHEFKTELGAGYRHEAYENGDTSDDMILDLAGHYRLDLADWVRFTHSTVYSPNIEEFSDYRLRLDTAFLFPLEKEYLSIKVGMKNEYNSRPQPGRDRLDNTYYASVVLIIK
jgi:putative salt-induced outer membrane protein